ncbi:hypothetical protein [Thalassomonas sp. RHCl1]|uniref:hypothetical protein n=1 Tax=Thalassomonas sp. RHCl1 TaxID=2995320 RepID=UPI00248B60B4|nr:hypothetical protein [Thalassomonas sp. RHCl1]
MKDDHKAKDKRPLFHTPKAIEVSKNWLWPFRIIFFVLSCHFINKAYMGYEDESFFFIKQFSLADGPILFNIMLIMFLLCAVGFFWQAFKIRVKKHNK